MASFRNIATYCRRTSNYMPVARLSSVADTGVRPGSSPTGVPSIGGSLRRKKVAVVLAENPTVIAGHAFTTGKIKRTSFETVSGGALVEYAMKDGVGCNAGHFVPAELEGKITADEHIHEHATCFNVKDRGLVVISSCGHVGIVNTV